MKVFYNFKIALIKVLWGFQKFGYFFKVSGSADPSHSDFSDLWRRFENERFSAAFHSPRNSGRSGIQIHHQRARGGEKRSD